MPIIVSSHGQIATDHQGLVDEFHRQCSTGCDGCETINQIKRFDVSEWERFYPDQNFSEVGHIDILDIGYWLENGAYEPPEADWRGADCSSVGLGPGLQSACK